MKAIEERELLAIVEHLSRSGSIVRSQVFSVVQFRKLRAAGLLAPAFVRHWFVLVKGGVEVDLQRDWAAFYWEFISAYCRHRFGDAWCLSPEASLAWWAEDRSPPAQLTVRSPMANNQRIDLGPAGSLYLLRADLGEPPVRREGQMVMSREAALFGLGAEKWRERAIDCVSAIGGFKDGRSLAKRVLASTHAPNAAEGVRVLGALRFLGKSSEAQDVKVALKRVFYIASARCPFDQGQSHAALDAGVAVPPAATRVRMMWLRFRDQLLAQHLDWASERFAGPALSPDIVRAKAGDLAGMMARWSAKAPDERGQQNLARAIQWLADDLDQAALGSPVDLLVRDRLDAWQAVLCPLLQGWRSSDACFPWSRHIPMRPSVLRHAMGALFECLAEEPLPRVRAAVAPLILQIIHPYPAANGRVARLLSLFLHVLAGSFSPRAGAVDRAVYLSAIEAAAVDGDARPWNDLVTAGWQSRAFEAINAGASR